MPTTASLSDLRTLVRDLGEYRSSQISNDMIDRWVNLANARFYDAMIDRDEARYTTSEDISVTAGTATYDLDGTFYRLVGLDVADASKQSGYETLERVQFNRRNEWRCTSKRGARFEIRNGKLTIYPIPEWSGTVRVHFVPRCPPLVSSAGDDPRVDAVEAFDYIDYWQDLVAFDVAIKCALRLDEDPSALMAERDRLDRMIRGKTARVDHSGPKTVRDVYDSPSRFGDFAEDWSG